MTLTSALFKYKAKASNALLRDESPCGQIRDPDFWSNPVPVWAVCGPYYRSHLAIGDIVFFIPQKKSLRDAGFHDYIFTGFSCCELCSRKPCGSQTRSAYYQELLPQVQTRSVTSLEERQEENCQHSMSQLHRRGQEQIRVVWQKRPACQDCSSKVRSCSASECFRSWTQLLDTAFDEGTSRHGSTSHS